MPEAWTKNSKCKASADQNDDPRGTGDIESTSKGRFFGLALRMTPELLDLAQHCLRLSPYPPKIDNYYVANYESQIQLNGFSSRRE